MKAISGWLKTTFIQCELSPWNGGYLQNYTYTRNEKTISERNVIGIREGNSNRPAIIISAHYDHIGIKKNHADSICNGADDNASGVAVLLSIAQYLKTHQIRNKNPIIFAAFSGEEHGLKGSEFFCRNLKESQKNILLNINFDMMGRTDEIGTNKFYITGNKYTNLEKIFREYNQDKDWNVESIGELNKLLYMMSNSYSFANTSRPDSSKIPAHTIGIGLPDSSYLHKPNDKAKYINFKNLAHFSEYIAEFIVYLGSNPFKVKWLNPSQDTLSIQQENYELKMNPSSTKCK